jgi:hypothetical protein
MTQSITPDVVRERRNRWVVISIASFVVVTQAASVDYLHQGDLAVFAIGMAASVILWFGILWTVYLQMRLDGHLGPELGEEVAR